MTGDNERGAVEGTGMPSQPKRAVLGQSTADAVDQGKPCPLPTSISPVSPGNRQDLATATVQASDGHSNNGGPRVDRPLISSSPLSVPSGESMNPKRLSLPIDATRNPYDRLSLPRCSSSMALQTPPQARLAKHASSSSHLPTPRRPIRSSPLTEVAFSSANIIKLDDPVDPGVIGGKHSGRYKPSRISSTPPLLVPQAGHVDDAQHRAPRPPPATRHGPSITFAPSTSISYGRPTTRSRYSYGQSTEASTSALPLSSSPSGSTSTTTSSGRRRPRSQHRPSGPFDDRYPPPPNSRPSSLYQEPRSRSPLDLDRGQVHRQGRSASSRPPLFHPQSTNRRLSAPPGRTGNQQDSWLTSSTYGTTPRFTRLGLAAQGVVLPVSAREFHSRHQARPIELHSNYRDNTMTRPTGIVAGSLNRMNKELNEPSTPVHRCPNDFASPHAVTSTFHTIASLSSPPTANKALTRVNSKPNKLRKPRPSSLSPPLAISDTSPPLHTSSPASPPTLNDSPAVGDTFEGQGEVEKRRVIEPTIDSYPRNGKFFVERNQAAGEGAMCTTEVLPIEEQDLLNSRTDTETIERDTSSDSDLPRTSSGSSVASSAPSLSLSLEASSASFYTTRTTLTEETTPSSSIFALPRDDMDEEGEATANGPVDGVKSTIGSDTLASLGKQAPPPMPASQPLASRSTFSRVCSFRSARSFRLRTHSKVDSLEPLSRPLPIYPISAPPTGFTPTVHSTDPNAFDTTEKKRSRLSISLSRTSTGTRLKKKRPVTKKLNNLPEPSLPTFGLYGDGRQVEEKESSNVKMSVSRRRKLLGFILRRVEKA